MGVREIWEEHSEVLYLVWEDLCANQKKYSWPSRTIGLSDLVDGLLAAYDRACVRAEKYRKGYDECWALWEYDEYEDQWVLRCVGKSEDSFKEIAKTFSEAELDWKEGIYDSLKCFRARADDAFDLRLSPYKVK